MNLSKPRTKKPWATSVESIMGVAKMLAGYRDALSVKNFNTEAKLTYGLDNSAARKLARLSTHPIISDPQYWPMLPPYWALLHEISYLPDEVIREKIENGGLLNISKYDVWSLRGISFTKTSQGATRLDQRVQVQAPPGSIVEQCRSGLAIEKDKGIPAHEAAAVIGIAIESYRKIRSLILLSDRADMLDADAIAIKEALEQIDRTRNVRRYYVKVRHIVEKVWGTNKKISKNSKNANKRIEAFKNVVGVIHHACQKALDVELPYMSKDDIAASVNELSEARRSISQLVDKVRRLADE